MDYMTPAIMLVGVGVIFLLLFFTFFQQFKQSERRAPVEASQTVLYSEDCTGYLNGDKQLFIRLRVYNGFMVVSCSSVFVIYPHDVDAVQINGIPYITRNVRIRFRTAMTSQKLELLSLNCENLKKMIERHLDLQPKLEHSGDLQLQTKSDAKDVTFPTFPHQS